MKCISEIGVKKTEVRCSGGPRIQCSTFDMLVSHPSVFVK